MQTSGGFRKEGPSLATVLVMREKTERPKRLRQARRGWLHGSESHCRGNGSVARGLGEYGDDRGHIPMATGGRRNASEISARISQILDTGLTLAAAVRR